MDIGEKGGILLSELCVQELCLSWDTCSLDGGMSMTSWGRSRGIYHHRGYSISLLVPSAQLQGFFPACSSLCSSVVTQLLQQNKLINQSHQPEFP